MADIENKVDNVAGKAKEAAGKVTNNDDLANEGKAEQVISEAKDKLSEAGDSIKETADKVGDSIKEKADEVIAKFKKD